VSSDHPREHEHDEHIRRPGGSGTSGPDTAEKRQAGSYSRDAEQNPGNAPDPTAESESDPGEGKTEPDEDEYGKVGSGDDADTKTGREASRVDPKEADEFAHANDDD
jgi:hypothetical protein